MDQLTDSPPRGGLQRRHHTRHLVCIAAQVEREGNRRPAVTWDVSASGIQLLTRADLVLGDPVRVVLYMPDNEDPGAVVEGTVVRSTSLSPDRIGLWSRSIAVELDRPQPELKRKVEELAAHQAEVFGLPQA